MRQSTLKDIFGIWTIDDGSGKVIKNLSGNGSNGEINGNAKWVDGEIGKALKLS